MLVSFTQKAIVSVQFYPVSAQFQFDYNSITDYFDRRAKVDEFNKQNRWRKRGIAVANMLFPTLYIASFSTYVAIYHGDGTVAVTHGGVEIGQGINTKLVQVVAHELGIPLDMITVTSHNTIIMANRSVTGGTITSESVCMAAKMACVRLLERMKPIREKNPNATWLEIVNEAWAQSIELTEKQTFENRDAKGYNVVGCACAEMEVDVLTGNYQILRVDIAEDTGRSMSPLVDVGQIEGRLNVIYPIWWKNNYSPESRCNLIGIKRSKAIRVHFSHFKALCF